MIYVYDKHGWSFFFFFIHNVLITNLPSSLRWGKLLCYAHTPLTHSLERIFIRLRLPAPLFHHHSQIMLSLLKTSMKLMMWNLWCLLGNFFSFPFPLFFLLGKCEKSFANSKLIIQFLIYLISKWWCKLHF